MKKIAILIGIILLLTSCNLPRAEVDPSSAVATNVAFQLTNAPTPTAIPDLNQGIMSTTTPEPVNTEEPAENQPHTQETEAPTEPPTEVPTEAPVEPTPVPPIDDPATRLGDANKVEEFNQATGAWNYEDEWFSVNVSGGQMHIYSKGTPYWNSWYTTQPTLKNFYFEATLSMVNCSGKDRIGLAFRNTNNQFYIVGLTCDGTIGMNRYTAENRVVDVLTYQPSDKLNPTNQENRIGVLANGSDFQIYVNGHLVGQVTDNSLPDAGTCGFVTMSTGTVNMKTSVETLRYWLLP